jgi:hypothetical protein
VRPGSVCTSAKRVFHLGRGGSPFSATQASVSNPIASCIKFRQHRESPRHFWVNEFPAVPTRTASIQGCHLAPEIIER